MDPNETLRMIRLYTKRINGELPSDETIVELAQNLAEYVGALDEWLSKGGFLPSEWQAVSNNGW